MGKNDSYKEYSNEKNKISSCPTGRLFELVVEAEKKHPDLEILSNLDDVALKYQVKDDTSKFG